ncbi:beta-N-acetylhexosaminidase [Gryllotalpicola protaetiae]|uniref:beta-N-acetylhexosaminidase n=1 Tax=Gryllotalpicola protaetiae TaxID=2419771 RepID=A0A387BPL7_9MICO|nr:beta-N-acetylhexosaminidase [Gryllotalpicola protaetiae]AYG02896.1 beta-N-acetylhexosaminidase [Gryllotalpicola protaetiae]
MTTALLPLPAQVHELVEPGFRLDATTSIAAPDVLRDEADWLRSALRAATGLPLHEAGDAAAAAIVFALDEGIGAEAYRLTTSVAGIRIVAGDAAGAFYAAQAVLQLLPPAVYRRARVTGVDWVLPAVSLADAPRFGWRGAMLDVARHFMPKHDVLRFIDLLAAHRLNVLHLHLTEDQGWRIEILRYPRLTEVGAWRAQSQVGAGPDAVFDGRPHGGFYTQDDLREIVAYAASRHIDVVPEIDVPGHSQAAIAAYPELGVTGEQLEVYTRWGINPNVLNMEEATVRFYQGVLDEVMAIFPSRFIGVGGDECPKDLWESDSRTRELMAERGLTTGEELQTWFIRRLDEHLTASGRRLFGWDEVLEGELDQSAVVASWRGSRGAVTAARRGHDVVLCPDDSVYLDYRQSDSPDEPIPVSIVLTVDDVYAFEPVPAELTAEQAAHVLGGQANIWTEHMDSPRTVDFFAFPRLAALAEVLWSSAPKDLAGFRARLTHHLLRLDALGVEYRADSGPKPWQRRPGIAGRPSTREQRAQYMDSVTANIAD